MKTLSVMAALQVIFLSERDLLFLAMLISTFLLIFG